MLISDIMQPADIFEYMLKEAGFRLVSSHARGLTRSEYHKEVVFEPKAPGSTVKRRLWRFDFVFVGKVAVEVNGGVFARSGAKRCRTCGHTPQGRHTTGIGYTHDCEKGNAALLLGYRVLHFTPDMVNDGSAMLALKKILTHGEIL